MPLLELETIPEEEPDTFEAPHVAYMVKREKRGAPKVTAKPLDEVVHQGYDARQAHAFEAFNKYCERVMSERSLEMFIEESYVVSNLYAYASVSSSL